MAITDEFGNRCDMLVRLHFRMLQSPVFDLAANLRTAQRFYGKYGIVLRMASLQSVNASADVHERLVRVEAKRGEFSKEMAELDKRFSVRELWAINVMLVQQIHRPGISAGPLGCGFYPPDPPLVILTADACDWVLAHEIGHVLLAEHAPGHSKGSNELMRAGPEHLNTEASPIFNEKQQYWARQSPFCLPC